MWFLGDYAEQLGSSNLPEAFARENCVLKICGKTPRTLRMSSWKTLVLGVRKELFFFFFFPFQLFSQVNNMDKVTLEGLSMSSILWSGDLLEYVCEVVQVHWAQVSLELTGIIGPVRGRGQNRTPRAFCRSLWWGQRDVVILSSLCHLLENAEGNL